MGLPIMTTVVHTKPKIARTLRGLLPPSILPYNSAWIGYAYGTRSVVLILLGFIMNTKAVIRFAPGGEKSLFQAIPPAGPTAFGTVMDIQPVNKFSASGQINSCLQVKTTRKRVVYPGPREVKTCWPLEGVRKNYPCIACFTTGKPVLFGFPVNLFQQNSSCRNFRFPAGKSAPLCLF